MKSIKVYSNEQKCSLAEWQAAQTSFRAFMDNLDVDLMICNGRTGFNHLPVANQFCPLLFVCSYQFVFSKFTNKSLNQSHRIFSKRCRIDSLRQITYSLDSGSRFLIGSFEQIKSTYSVRILNKKGIIKCLDH